MQEEVWTPYSSHPGPAALNSSHRCCVRLCKVQLHHAPLHNAACAWQRARASFIDQVLSARASWSGERCLLLGVPCCGSHLFQLTTTSQNVGAELPPSSLLPSSPAVVITQQWHQGSTRAQGTSCSPGHPEQGASLLGELPATHPIALREPAPS